jgi:acetyl-CoA C-acetyltransferase
VQKDTVVIVSMARTPQGKLLGNLKDLSATDLGAVAIKEAIKRAGIPAHDVQEVIMGCVLPAGIGQAPARQAALKAGLSNHTSCTTINKVCGSGMKAVIFAHDALVAGSYNIVVAGGMESMSNAPYLLLKGRQGYRLGHQELVDHMLLDGLEDAYEKGRSMGSFAELCAEQYEFTREAQDDYAITSLKRAQHAIQEKLFAAEIVPVTVTSKQGETVIDTDEHPLSVNIEKIPLLSPAFKKDGTITAANSSSIADGAAALVLMRLQEAEKRGLKPLARIIEHVSVAKAPSQFTTAPIDAIRKLLDKIPWYVEQVDLFEINEAFAVVAMAAMRDLNIPHEKLNIHGGGCALGHPIGATGARIIVSLINGLQQQSLKRGIACLCIGGGEATAVAIEII